MRKSYLIAAAAMIMVSCAQNEKLFNDLQDDNKTVIGFTSYSQKATRGDTEVSTNLEYYHNTFAVYGTKQSTVDNTIQYLFGGKAEAAGTQNGVTCSYLDPTLPTVLGDWRYDDPRFWEKQANFDFIAYAPVSDYNPIRYYYGAADALVGATTNYFKSTATYTLEGTNIQATPSTTEKVKGFNVNGHDLDLMVSAHSGPISGAAHQEYVNLEFRHILSKLNVKVAKGEGLNNSIVKVKEITITGFKNSGDYNSTTYDPGNTTGWTLASTAAAYNMTNTAETTLNDGSYAANSNVFTAGAPYFFIESLIIPQAIADDQITVTVKYSIKASAINNLEQDFTFAFDLYDLVNMRTFREGYNYTLFCTIQPDIIKFDATTATWANVSAEKDIITEFE